ncbi:MAG: spermidine synthase, partial [Gemmatimonadota bacterium]
MLLHPEPDSVFFLGLGTSITAGAALEHPVRSLTAAELVPEVVTAAREYFTPYTNGLFSDPRVRIIAEDGRNYLQATSARYDVVVGDLYVPWH